MNQIQTKSQIGRQPIFDVVKYIMALMVVAIHSDLFPEVLYPWLRLAVPLFFMISSYFFFRNLQCAESAQEKNQRYRKFIKRNFILYLFWFIVLLPYTLHVRQYFNDGVISGIIRFTKSLLFRSTFPASWFIQALIVSITIVFFISKKMKNSYLLTLAIFVYCFAVFKSSYWGIINTIPVLDSIYNGYEVVFSSPVFNASSALIWVVIGKYFAEDKVNINNVASILGLIVSGILLYGEWLLVRELNDTIDSDCYFLLIPTTFFAFNLIRCIKVPLNGITKFLGNSSTLVYTTHVPTIFVTSVLLKRLFSITDRLYVFLLVVFLCTLGSYVVFQLEKYRAFKWLKYSH